MDRFRVISDIHLDINGRHTPSFNDGVFTVICGDTSGYPEKTVEWVKNNVKYGVGVSGNHLPYNDKKLPIQSFRESLASAFPASGDFTYLDAECGIASKEVDDILFVGSCFYSDMKITSAVNQTGDAEINKRISRGRMNDYKWGISKIDGGTTVRISPDDYVKWNENALSAFDKIITDNEKSARPKDVVVLTHYPMVRDIPDNSFYVEDDNICSYGNDMISWFDRHWSVKCHCCGHCHDMKDGYRHFKVHRDCGNLLVVNNSFGYWHELHDMTFNPNLFVNTRTWEIEAIPEPEDVKAEKEARRKKMFGMLAYFM